jgi:membrane associated rhomboid family serine protease
MRKPPQWTEARHYPVTSGTILLATAATLAWWTDVDMSALLETADVRRGQLWRFVTSALLHGDALHLIFNLYWLWVFGTLVEAAFGHVRTALLLTFLAFASGAASYALEDGGVGLSGVGYGLFAMLWVLSRRRGHDDPRFAGAVDVNTVTLFVMWFFLCAVATYYGTMNVGNVAHGAGAAFGALVGIAVSSRAGAPRRLIGAGTALLALACLAGATVARPYVAFSKHAGEDEAYLGYEALVDKRYDEAAHWLRDAVHMNPRRAGWWYNLGIALEGINRPDDAHAAYKRALALNPDNADFRHAVAGIIPPRPDAPPPTSAPSSAP